MGWQDAPEVAGAPKWASAPEVSQAAPMGKGEALLRGAAQGATMGFGDEMEAGWKSMLGGGKYSEIRDKLRADEQSAQQQHPVLHTAGEVVGGVAPALLGGGASAGARLLAAAGQGAIQGAGYSNAGDTRSLARDTALGAGLGTLGHGVGEALSGLGRGVVRYARGRSAAAVAKAGEQAAQEVAGGIQSAKSALGSEVQKGSRYVENLMRLEESMTPQQKALYQSLHPEVENLQQRVAQSTLEALPDQAKTIAAKDAEYAAAKTGASQALQDRKAELLKPQIGADVASLAKSYGEPLAAAALAPPGMKEAAGLIFGRTRAGKALMMRVNRPGNQKAVFDTVANVADSKPGELLRLLLSRGAAAPITQSLVEEK